MAGKALLPGYGGSFMVWAVALAFFQGALLSGYATVHLCFGRTVSRSGLFFYSALLLGTSFSLKLNMSELGSGPQGNSFVFSELLHLFRQTGFPVLCLASTSVALQRFWWFSAGKFSPEISASSSDSELPQAPKPYFLYSASNFGSFLGLISFPFLIEPFFEVQSQVLFWKGGFYLWVILMFFSLPWPGEVEVDSPQGCSEPQDCESIENPARPISDIGIQKTSTNSSSSLKWFLPSLAGSSLLSSTTNILTMDLSSTPIIWMFPLAIYLWTFVKVFNPKNEGESWWLEHFPQMIVFSFSLALLNILGFALGAVIKIILHLGVFYGLCFAANFVLAAEKPESPQELTRYYLWISVGGLFGSSLVAFIIPLCFKGLMEFPLSIFLVSLAVWREPFWKVQAPDPFLFLRLTAIFFISGVFPALANIGMPETGSFLISATAGALIYSFIAFRESQKIERNRVLTAAIMTFSLIFLDVFGATGAQKFILRNYYGIYRVFDTGEIRYLQMGSTYHGHEAIDGPDKGKPLMYYHPETVIGRFFQSKSDSWENMGVLGLGAGTLAAFAKPGQSIDFYELDPDGVRIAYEFFSFLPKTGAKIQIFEGDGRLKLREAATSSYDLLIMDAFSSDSIPTHLLTIEAIREYRNKIRDDGLILFHVSNRHVDLVPVLVAAAEKLEIEVKVALNAEREEARILPTRWVAIGNPEGFSRHLSDCPDWEVPATHSLKIPPWTDGFSNLLYVLTLN